MPDVTLRPMTASEFDSLRSSLIAEYGAAQVRAGGWDEATADERASAQLDALVPQGIDTDGMLLRIAEDPGGRRVGHLWLSLAHEGSPDTAWIYDIEIAAGRRGQGFGRALLAAAEDEIRRHGVGNLGLNVFGDNPSAISLYESAGYQVTTQQMSKRLS